MSLLRLTCPTPCALQSPRWLPSGCRKEARKLLASPVDVASRRHLRNTQHLADLVERQSLFVSQCDRCALVGPERGHGTVKCTLQCRLLDGIG